MNQAKPSLAVRCLGRIADGVCHYPKWFVVPQFVLFFICILYTYFNLEFKTDRSDLVDADRKYHKNFLIYKSEFQSLDDLVTVVESEEPEKNRQFVERLGAKLETQSEWFTDIFYKGDLKLMGTKALLFIQGTNDLVTMRNRIRDSSKLISQFAEANDLNSLFRIINSQFRAAAQNTNEVADIEVMLETLPALQRILDQATGSLRRRGTPPSPGVEAFFGAGAEAERQKYITFQDGRMYLLTARPATADLEKEAVLRLRQLVKETQAEVPGVNVGITGESILEYDEMEQSKRDSAKATVVSLILVAVIFIFGYQETGRPIKATVCLLLGLGYTMGYTTLIVGHLNILTIAFVPMLIGLAIDFGVHLITRYEEELRHGASAEAAVRTALIHTGHGIFTGCFTTAGAFFAMALTEFKGVKEMGLITGGGMLASLIPMTTVLPVLLLRGRQNVLDHRLPVEESKRARMEKLWLARPGLTVGLTVTLCLFALPQLRNVYFDYNLLNMQTAGLPAVLTEHKLIESGDKSVLFAAVITDDLDGAQRIESEVRNMTSIASVESMTTFLTEDQAEKLVLVRDIKDRLGGITFAEPNEAMLNVEALHQTLTFFGSYLGRALEKLNEKSDREELASRLASLKQSASTLQRAMMEPERTSVSEQLTAFERALFSDVGDTFEAIANQNADSQLGVEDIPPALKNRFISSNGKYLIQVYPRENVWERENQEEFISQLRTLDADETNEPIITGTPIQLYEYTTLLKRSYEEAAWYALAAIAVLVFIHFRSILAVVFALTPVLIGTIWLTGFMGIFKIPFNPANIMTLPLVIGIGVTNGIHILNRFAEEEHPRILSKSTGKGVMVSGLTTVAGFGSLTLAKHQGIQSLGFVMAIGVTTCMLAGVAFLPCLLRLAMKRGWSIKKKTQ